MRIPALLLSWTVVLAVGTQVFSGEPTRPGPTDRCAVCGMFVAKYVNWIAIAEFDDGSLVFFDGPKDMFKYLFDIARFDPSKEGRETSAVFVTDYYSTELIDGKEAFYVAGGDVVGPMGPELVPFVTREDAEEFLRDHRGERILSYDEIGAKEIPR